jgi:hypothetical protein
MINSYLKCPACGVSYDFNAGPHQCSHYSYLQNTAPTQAFSEPVTNKLLGDATKGLVDGGGYKASMDDPKKPPMQFLTPQFIEGMAKVMANGRKYGDYNWTRGMSFEEVRGAVLRHVNAIGRGEDIDPDSGLPHELHAACSLMFLHFYKHGPTAASYAQFDDRKYGTN